MRRVILESPYAGDIEANVAYARRCLRDCLQRGEAPIASHLLFTQPGVLRDDVPEERKLGIEAGLAWGGVADYAVFYTDRGWSGGMRGALEHCLTRGIRFGIRAIDGPRPGFKDLPPEVVELLEKAVIDPKVGE